ncbi:MAG: maltose alpha-D-glucosyltransferase [Azospirillum sp.]|nr:maltose alpha-D-glucosyltransferase [Azospirillum sp.]
MTDLDPQWYRDAIIYEVHVKSFFDSNSDGIGDFPGLLQKLDYLRDLGVTAVWLLPFYPSPLRDDGYDISDYRSIHPSYGTMRDFRAFVKAAHALGIRVITELVINHTSDQHPWFQRARKAAKGSKARNFYVWSDDDGKWPETRIIFTDTESSNWTWDPVAEQYYWHRFFSHQPDLNFDNPRVVEAVVEVMRFWLDLGVDGLRLDAIPYLLERDGTNNENLPETHAVLRKLRAALDASHPNAFFLAEANQWPEDTAHYFGSGDECHMCFHFPLMPRMYMAMAQEDRYPITDIIRQTPDVPDGCQWAIFLRNHDELTLEMVTDRERDNLWQFFAADKRARINLGIRRRLAPLMDNDQRKIKLLNSLLFSMPGTPIVYYGDEIGMGDNIYLGDRNGVRTPMQWSADRNGGFSRADYAQLYLPVIANPQYGYQAISVEAQGVSASSPLNWLRQIIAVRKRHQAFGRGSFTLLYPGNRKVLAYIREYQGERILCVANLARSAQAVELDLHQFKGAVPVELVDRVSFPPIGDLPYLLTLPGYAFFWFLLADSAALPSWHEPIPEPMPDLITLVLRDWAELPASRAGSDLARAVLPLYLAKQRWFAAKDAQISDVRLIDFWTQPANAELPSVLVEAQFADGRPAQRYFLPLTAKWDESLVASGSPLLGFTLAKIRRGPKLGALLDGAQDEAFTLAVVEAMRRSLDLRTAHGRIEFRPTPRLAEVEIAPENAVRPLGVDQSNTSCLVEGVMVLKVLRKLEAGVHPELEIGRFLTEVAKFPNIPALYGAVEHHGDDGTPTALAVLQQWVRNQGDGWRYTRNLLRRELGELRLGIGDPILTSEDRFALYVAMATTLGQRTAELHRALAIDCGDPAFDPEPLTADDRRELQSSAAGWLDRAVAALTGLPPGSADPAATADTDALLARQGECRRLIDSCTALDFAAAKTRIHGDFHLGQALVVENDFVFVDFEGEPARPLAERRRKSLPLRDVAGMLRSFDYAAWAVVAELLEADPSGAETLIGHALLWRDLASAAFRQAYAEHAEGLPSFPADPAVRARLLEILMLEKALYEVTYEAANRPTWLHIPVRGVLAILDAASKPEREISS